MTTNIKVNGVDLDSILAPIVGFNPRAAVNIETAGVDLASRYAPSANGRGTVTTHYESGGGFDIGTLFAPIGTAIFVSPNGGTFDLGSGFGSISYDVVVNAAVAGNVGAITNYVFSVDGQGTSVSQSNSSFHLTGSTTGNKTVSMHIAVSTSESTPNTANGAVFVTLHYVNLN